MKLRSAAAVLALSGLFVGTAATTASAADGLTYAGYQDFQSEIARTVDAYWSTLLGSGYQSPDYVAVAAGTVRESPCGGEAGDPAESEEAEPAFYCRLDRTVNVSSGWMYREVYGRFGDAGAGYAIAHEWSHHVQEMLGIGSSAQSPADEMQADCLAGTWVRAMDVAGELDEGDLQQARATAAWVGDKEFDSPGHHGSPEERVFWFDKGYDTGDPDVCAPPR